MIKDLQKNSDKPKKILSLDGGGIRGALSLGYLKKIDINKAYKEWWDRLSGDEKQCIKEIPNFDAKKFEMITGINAER